MTIGRDIAAAAAHTAPAHTTYRPDVDGLRALAIVPVVIFHAFPSLAPGGFVGVDVFFVISGYLISSIIFAALERGRFSFAGFYVRRIKRIFPALALVLIFCLAWGWRAQFASEYALLGKHVAGGAGFVANLLYWNEAGYFDAASDTKPLLHLWSLGIEEQFYLLWPALVVVCWRLGAPLSAVIALIGLASFGWNVVLVRSDEVAAFYAPWTRLWELLLGSGLAYLNRPEARPASVAAWVRRIAATPNPIAHAMSVAGVVAVTAAVATFSPDTSFPGWRASLPTVGTLLVIAAGAGGLVNRRLLAQPALVWIGLISYPLYLWHWPLLSYARLAAAGTPTAAVRSGVVAASVVLAWATFAIVERRIRFGRTGRGVVPALCGVIALSGALGYIVYAGEGFIDRPINRSDRAHFLQYYERMRKDGTLQAAYRSECDFLDWQSEKNRDAIDPSCTAPGSAGTFFLWGDSHAQALSPGIRSLLPDTMRLAQVTTSGCAPRLSEPNPEALSGRCERANAYARARIAALKPAVVILAQILAHEATDWDALAGWLHASGVRQVVLVGPAPQWHPSLPVVVTRDYWDTPFERVKEGLDPEMFETDRILRERYAASAQLAYVSLVGALCTADGCLAIVPGTDRQLMTVDAGHFTPAGSTYVGAAILRPALPLP